MADPHWTSYVGMATGIAGAVMAFLGGRKINKIKSLDLRIELKKAVIDVDKQHNSLQEKMELANRSRINMSSALGRTGSGMMKKWKEDFDNDQATWKALEVELPDINEKYEKLNPGELEDKLIEIHELKGRVNSLTDTYTESLIKDEEDGRQLREDMRANFK